MLDSAVASFLLMIVTFATGVLLTRLLGPENRGVYGAVQFWSQIFVGLLSVSFFEAALVVSRGRPEHKPVAPLPMLFIISAGAACVIAAIVTVATMAGVFDKFRALTPGFPYLILLLAGLLLVTNAFGTYESIKLSFRRLNIERVVTPALFVAIVPVLIILDTRDPAIAVLAYASASLPMLLYRLWRYRQEIFGSVDAALFGATAKLARRFYFELVSTGLNREVDRFIVVFIWSAEQLGYYFVAFSAAGASLALVLQGIRMVLLPNLTGIENAVRRDRTERLLRLSLLMAALICGSVWLAAPIVVPLAYGADFSPATSYLQGMIIPLSLTPMMSIITASARSMGSSTAGIQMAWASLLIIGAGFLVTGYSQTEQLFASMTIANLIAIGVGLRQLKRLGIVSLRRSIMPQFNDLQFICEHTVRYGGHFLRRRGP